MAGIQFVPVGHLRLVGSPAEAYFAIINQSGEVHDSKLPIAQFDSDIFDFFETYANSVGRQHQIVAGVFELSESSGRFEGLDCFVYFQQTIVMLYHVSYYAPDENQ